MATKAEDDKDFYLSEEPGKNNILKTLS
jgi:hypothetical protein